MGTGHSATLVTTKRMLGLEILLYILLLSYIIVKYYKDGNTVSAVVLVRPVARHSSVQSGVFKLPLV